MLLASLPCQKYTIVSVETSSSSSCSSPSSSSSVQGEVRVEGAVGVCGQAKNRLLKPTLYEGNQDHSPFSDFSEGDDVMGKKGGSLK